MSSVTALLGVAARLAGAGRQGGVSRSLDVSPVEGLPSGTTVIAGGESAEIRHDPELLAWFGRVVGTLSGDAMVSGTPPGRVGAHAAWPILHEGGGVLDPSPLQSAIAEGTAWVVALRPERFFAQAADRFEARGDAHGADWAAQLRNPTGTLALLGTVVRVVSLSLKVDEVASLRLRASCPDEPAARQAVLALHAWRLRRGAREGAHAAAFRASDLVRDGARVELTLTGSVAMLTTVVGRR